MRHGTDWDGILKNLKEIRNNTTNVEIGINCVVSSLNILTLTDFIENLIQNEILSKPGVDTSKLPSTGFDPGQSYQDAILKRLSPQLDRENQSFEQEMANKGIGAGTQAYNTAKQLLAQNQNDRLTSATVQGINTGLTANQQAFNQAGYNQMQPINVINALRTGSQVSTPNYVNPALQSTTQGPDLLAATTNKYNAQLGATNAANANTANFTSGLMNLGGQIFG
jgi:hypothetical protein